MRCPFRPSVDWDRPGLHYVDVRGDFQGMPCPMRANPRLHAKPFSKLSLRVYVGASTCVVWIGIGIKMSLGIGLLVSPQLRGWSPSLRVIEGDSIHLLPTALKVPSTPFGIQLKPRSPWVANPSSGLNQWVTFTPFGYPPLNAGLPVVGYKPACSRCHSAMDVLLLSQSDSKA